MELCFFVLGHSLFYFLQASLQCLVVAHKRKSYSLKVKRELIIAHAGFQIDFENWNLSNHDIFGNVSKSFKILFNHESITDFSLAE